MTSQRRSLQELNAPHGMCFGCGPQNSKGLQIRSHVNDDDSVVCQWHAQPHHEAFPSMLCGGIIGTLLDCHSNWTAAYSIMKQRGVDVVPCTVTAKYSIALKRPTPSGASIHLFAKTASISDDRATVTATLVADDLVCATCEGLFVAVKEDHPAYHRW